MKPQTPLEKEQLDTKMVRHWQSPESQRIANEALESQKAIIDAQIDTARAQADTYNETLDSIQWVEEDINKTWFAGLLEKLKWTVSWIWEKTKSSPINVGLIGNPVKVKQHIKNTVTIKKSQKNEFSIVFDEVSDDLSKKLLFGEELHWLVLILFLIYWKVKAYEIL